MISLKKFIKLNTSVDMAIECKYGHGDKEWQIKEKDWIWIEHLEYANVKGDLLAYKYLCCNRITQQSLMNM